MAIHPRQREQGHGWGTSLHECPASSLGPEPTLFRAGEPAGPTPHHFHRSRGVKTHTPTHPPLSPRAGSWHGADCLPHMARPDLGLGPFTVVGTVPWLLGPRLNGRWPADSGMPPARAAERKPRAMRPSGDPTPALQEALCHMHYFFKLSN